MKPRRTLRSAQGELRHEELRGINIASVFGSSSWLRVNRNFNTLPIDTEGAAIPPGGYGATSWYVSPVSFVVVCRRDHSESKRISGRLRES